MKYLSYEGLAHLKLLIKNALDGKVSKENGKGLSTNDLTNELVTKINDTASTVEGLVISGGQANVIEKVKVNNTLLEVTDKTVNIEVPTNNNQLTNGAGYITGINTTDVTNALGFVPYNATNPNGYQTAADVSSAISGAIDGITGIEYTIVDALPDTGKSGVIYLLSNSGENTNSYDEYIYVNDKFEKIGTTDIDLSNYVQEEDLVAITNSEIDTIWANN